MSPETSPVEPAVLITIISESVLKDRIVQMLKSQSVSGYTITQVQGEGGRGRRLSDMPGYNTNVEIKTVVSKEVSEAILYALKEHKGKHALIAFRQNVEVLD